MSDAPTICRQCKHLFRVNKNDAVWRFLCMATPMPPAFNYVIGEIVADPPYQYAIKKNYGNCVDYREGVNSLSPNKLNSDGTPIDDQ